MPTSTPAGAATRREDVLEVLDAAASHGVTVWVDGGWGVDALLGAQTRDHGDLDLAVLASDAAALEGSLAARGYERCHEDSATPWSYLLAHPRGSVVDLHLIDLDDAGNGILGPPENNAVYPCASLRGEGQIGGITVRCISADSAVAFHDAYQGDDHDKADVLALCARFGLPIPKQYL